MSAHRQALNHIFRHGPRVAVPSPHISSNCDDSNCERSSSDDKPLFRLCLPFSQSVRFLPLTSSVSPIAPLNILIEDEKISFEFPKGRDHVPFKIKESESDSVLDVVIDEPKFTKEAESQTTYQDLLSTKSISSPNKWQIVNELGQHELSDGKPRKAYKHFKRAARHGCLSAVKNAALCHLNGIGTEKNLEKAFNFWLDGMKMGCPESEYNVAVCYLKGDGVTLDARKGREIMDACAAKFYPPAGLYMALLVMQQYEQRPAASLMKKMMEYLKIAAMDSEQLIRVQEISQHPGIPLVIAVAIHETVKHAKLDKSI